MHASPMPTSVSVDGSGVVNVTVEGITKPWPSTKGGLCKAAALPFESAQAATAASRIRGSVG